jgi:DNA-binding NtrC family response regulator
MEEHASKEVKVLVVDDEPIVCKRLKRALSGAGWVVEAFEDPSAALEHFDRQNFDIVVTDVMMDDVDGIQVLSHVLARSPRTKVIVMTAYACRDLARQAVEKGAFDFIAKPFDAEGIRTIVSRAAKALDDDTPHGA